MIVHVFRTESAAARAAASAVARQIAHRPQSVIGLPAGRTAAAIYEQLVELYAGGEVNFAKARTVSLDEFAALDPRDPRSFRTFLSQHLLNRVALPKRRARFLNGHASDLERECRRYERVIRRLGGIDLQLLGLGTNGHIGFNEPSAALHARTHCAHLTPATRRANAGAFGGRVRDVPSRALTMGMATICDARSIVLVALGRAKARAARAALEGPIATSCPASLLQLHPRVEVILDAAAAALLTRRQRRAQ